VDLHFAEADDMFRESRRPANGNGQQAKELAMEQLIA
jgi:hypothetical protein